MGFRLSRWLYALSWTGTEQLGVLFDRAATWLLAHKVILPGCTTLERFVSRLRSRVEDRLWKRLGRGITDEQCSRLEDLLTVPSSGRSSWLDKLRSGPVRVSGRALLHVVQPALSRQLKLLEDELGVQVFERNRRGMQLTEAGRAFVEKVRHSLRELDRAKADVAASSRSLLGTVSIGMLPSWSESVSVPLVKSLRRQYPELTVRLTTGFTSELQSMLERGELDVALLGEYKPSAMLSMQVVLREALYVVGLPSSGLRADNPMTLSDAAKLPLILPAYPQGLRLMIDSACTIMGVRLNVVAESNSTSVQLNLVESEVGFTILPVVALTRYLDEGRLCAAPVTAPDLYRKLAIAQPVATRSSPSIQNVVEQMRLRLVEVVGAVNHPGIIWFENGVQDVTESAM